MEEERIELAELDTVETEDVQEDAEVTLAEETALAPEVVARQLFASYLEPSEAELEQEEDKGGDLPDEPTDEVAAALPVDDADLPAVSDEPVSEDDAAPAEEPAPDGDASADEDDAGEEPSEGGRNWFVIHSYSGYENKVKKNL